MRIAHLRARDEEWMTRRGSACRDEQRIACADRIVEMERGARSGEGRAKASVVEDDVARPARRVAVRKDAVDAHGRLRILPLGEEVPVLPRRRAEAPLQGVEEHRTPGLVAAADPEIR